MNVLELAMGLLFTVFLAFGGSLLILVGYYIIWKEQKDKPFTLILYVAGLAYYSLALALALSLFIGG